PMSVYENGSLGHYSQYPAERRIAMLKAGATSKRLPGKSLINSVGYLACLMRANKMDYYSASFRRNSTSRDGGAPPWMKSINGSTKLDARRCLFNCWGNLGLLVSLQLFGTSPLPC